MADRTTEPDITPARHRTAGPHLRLDIPRPRRSPPSLFQWSLFLIIFAGGITLMVWGFLAEWPTGPAFGNQFHGNIPSPQPFPDRIRIANYNIHGGRGRDGKRDLSRIARNLHGVHFAGLNEVHAPGGTRAPGQTELLARELNLNWLFAPTEWCWRGEHFGSAAVTNLPVEGWQRIPLEHRNAAGYRNLILIHIPTPQGKLKLVVTHLDRDRDRELQLRGVLNFFTALEKPAILMGDLNTPRHDPILRQAIDSGSVQDCISARSRTDLPPRIDWILSRGIAPVAAGLTDDGASDHPLIWAEFELKPTPPAPK